MARILLVTDDMRLSAELNLKMIVNNHTLVSVPDAGYASEILTREVFDLILIDIKNDDPSRSILEIMEKLAPTRSVLVLAIIPAGSSAKLQVITGIHDFCLKPVNLEEISTRIKLLLSRLPEGEDGETIRRGDLVVDIGRCEVTVNGRELMLTFKEYELLKFLAANPGRVFSRESLLEKVWGFDYYGGERTVDVHVRRLRSKFAEAGHDYIETLRNLGYRFNENA